MCNTSAGVRRYLFCHNMPNPNPSSYIKKLISPSRCQSSGERQHMAWSARQQCAPLPPSPSCLTTPHSVVDPHAPQSQGTVQGPQAVPGQGAQREGTCSNRGSMKTICLFTASEEATFFFFFLINNQWRTETSPVSRSSTVAYKDVRFFYVLCHP